MSLSSRKGSIIGNSYLKSLNPDAVEFVPFSHRPSPGSPSTSTSTADIRSSHQSSRSEKMGKSVLDRSESSISDDEVHRYWRQQLPDDIIPDFNLMAQEEPQVINELPFANLSLQENHDVPRFSASSSSRFIMKDQVELPPLRSSAPSYVDDVSSANLVRLPTKLWDDPVLKNDQLPTNSNEGSLYNGSFSLRRSPNAPLPDRATVEVPSVSPFELLTLQFPAVSTDNLAELYFSNGCDLNLTFEALNQRELQVERRIPEPIFGLPEFPALAAGAESPPGRYSTSGEESLVQPFSHFRPTTRANNRAALEIATTAIRNLLPRESNIGRNASPDAMGGSSYPHLFGQARGTAGEGFQVRTPSRASPLWMETGDAVGNMYAETREEARDHARLRNAYFEQARQAYFIGNKVLAKEMSMKGHLHNLQMKAAHGKVQESLLRQSRNNEMMMHHQHQQVNPGRVHERLIDLQGLQANEAIHILNRELTLLKLAARSDDQRVQVYICVGTINQARGARTTTARLPIVVQRYLLEEEGLDFTEPQAGLLRVVIR